ncbi:hypothetical protein EUX98_g9257 [Antrodiella citrinella]|uniref:Uncharacterized protein n=1 Tax=Antrodiella citrinella TaxID=2447956 RepID=A0A4S4M1R3_9APHY|nr:hypothetical protein EUX98_g9257 [Antrodiella citrinella]
MELLRDLKDLQQTVGTLADTIQSSFMFTLDLQSPNMVIVEIARSFGGWDSLLGEHKWNEFLRNPTPDERDRVSQIFYCTLASGQEVRDHGWLCKDVQSEWFQGSEWTPDNQYEIIYDASEPVINAAPSRRIIIRSYPMTSYCPLPVEDKTRAKLCRPLPVKSFPLPPPPPRLPPVGSQEWQALKEQKTKNVPALPVLQDAWASDAARRTSATGFSVAGPARIIRPLVSGSVRPLPSALSRNLSPPSGVTPPGLDITVLSPLVIPSGFDHISQVSASGLMVNNSPPGLTLVSAASSSSGHHLTPGAGDTHTHGEKHAHPLAALSLNEEADEGPAPEPVFEWAGYTFNEDVGVTKEPSIECMEHGNSCPKMCTQYQAQKREIRRMKDAADRLAEKDRKEAEKEKRIQSKTNWGNDARKTKYNILPQRKTQPLGTNQTAVDSRRGM